MPSCTRRRIPAFRSVRSFLTLGSVGRGADDAGVDAGVFAGEVEHGEAIKVGHALFSKWERPAAGETFFRSGEVAGPAHRCRILTHAAAHLLHAPTAAFDHAASGMVFADVCAAVATCSWGAVGLLHFCRCRRRKSAFAPRLVFWTARHVPHGPLRRVVYDADSPRSAGHFLAVHAVELLSGMLGVLSDEGDNCIGTLETLGSGATRD